MGRSDSISQEQRGAPLQSAAWLPASHVLAIISGTLAIGAFTTYVIRHNHQITLDHWRSELSASVSYQNWTLRTSLQQSQDDARMLADFAATRELLLGESNRGFSAGDLTALKNQVLDRFEEYRTIYEYDAVYLFDSNGRIAAQAAGIEPGTSVITGPKFIEIFGSVVRDRRFAVKLAQGAKGELTVVFLMPVFDSADSKRPPAESPIGVVVIIDRFARDLLPLIMANRTGSRTGATVLLQMESGLGRYLTIPAGSVHTSDTLLQGAGSAVENRASFGEYVDNRGVDVLAAMEKVENIGSVLVRKVDEDQALSDFRRVARIETIAAMSILLAYIGLIFMHNRNAVALAMRHGLERQQYINQVLEATVAERTGQLEQTNQKLQRELAERQRAEEEVRMLNADLDQRVKERTAELEVANKELEAFSYSVSHDLRAPLRRMRGFSTILLEEHAPQLTDEAQQLLQVVNRNAVQMGELIDCILAFSQLGRQPLRKQKVAAADVVRVAWQDLSAERDGREVEITICDLPVCEADPLLLKQIFINLLSNAIKYSRIREVAKIEVGCKKSGVYYVRDNGVGFDMRYLDKLFGVFKRLHRTEEYEGIGIGLAIVARIVYRHGGRVWAEAVLNEGATFYFTLA